MTTTMDQIKAQIEALSARFEVHVDREEAMWSDAFPDGDIVGHRRAHESMIEAAREQAAFWQELRIDLAKKSLWALVVIVVGLVAAGGLGWVATKLGVVVASGKP